MKKSGESRTVSVSTYLSAPGSVHNNHVRFRLKETSKAKIQEQYNYTNKAAQYFHLINTT